MALAREEPRPTEKRLREGRSAEGERGESVGLGRGGSVRRDAGHERIDPRRAAATRGRGGVTALHVRYVPRERLLPRCWEPGPPPVRGGCVCVGGGVQGESQPPGLEPRSVAFPSRRPEGTRGAPPRWRAGLGAQAVGRGRAG